MAVRVSCQLREEGVDVGGSQRAPPLRLGVAGVEGDELREGITSVGLGGERRGEGREEGRGEGREEGEGERGGERGRVTFNTLHLSLTTHECMLSSHFEEDALYIYTGKP